MANWFRRKKVPEIVAEEISQAEPHPSEELLVAAAVTEEPAAATDEQPVKEELTPERTQSVWRRGLARLRRVLTTPLGQLFRGRPFSEEIFVELEEALLGADVGVPTTTNLIERLRERCRKEKPTEASALRSYLKDEMLAVLQQQPNPPLVGKTRPWVILMIGVNGVGKTTSIAKLASRFRRQGKKVLLVEADTFRAAAIERLEVWTKALNLGVIKHQGGALPDAVAF